MQIVTKPIQGVLSKALPESRWGAVKSQPERYKTNLVILSGIGAHATAKSKDLCIC
jgi:hypothetical protein